MITPKALEKIRATAKARRVAALIERLTPLTDGQVRAVETMPAVKVKLAQAFSDPEIFVEYLKKVPGEIGETNAVL